MPRESKVGQAIYDAVQKLRADNPGMSQQAAFQALHDQDESRSVASIQANYYRVARLHRQDKGTPRRRARRAQQRVSVTPTNGTRPEAVLDFEKAESEIMLAADHAVKAVRVARQRFEAVQRLVSV